MEASPFTGIRTESGLKTGDGRLIDNTWLDPTKTVPRDGEEIEVLVHLAISGDRIYKGLFINGQLWCLDHGSKCSNPYHKLISAGGWGLPFHVGWRRLVNL